MGTTSGRRKNRTSKPPVRQDAHGLFGRATELAKIVKANDPLDMSSIMAAKNDINIPQLEKAIARCRRAIALQTRLLDELEAEVRKIKRDARKRRSAKTRKRTTRRKT